MAPAQSVRAFGGQAPRGPVAVGRVWTRARTAIFQTSYNRDGYGAQPISPSSRRLARSRKVCLPAFHITARSVKSQGEGTAGRYFGSPAHERSDRGRNRFIQP